MATRLAQGRPARQRRSSAEERRLALAFQSGDVASYQLIYDRFRPTVEGLCRRLLGNPHDAEEATQETFVRVLQALPRFNGRYRLRAWILRIATNVCLDMLRARRREQNGDPDLGEAADIDGHRGGNGNGNGHIEDPVEVLEREAESEMVRSVLLELPDDYRAALVLREVEGLSYQEIATALDTTPPRVKALLHRARRRFRRAWSAAGRSLGAVVPIPAVWAWLRRLVDRSSEVSSAAVAGAPAQAGTLASSLSVVGEKVVAVAAAVAVTGAATLGVISVRDRPSPGPTPTPPAVSAPTPALEERTPVAAQIAPPVEEKAVKKGKKAATETVVNSGREPVVLAPDPGDPATSPDPSASPDPTASPGPSLTPPSPGPGPEPSPEPAPDPFAGPPPAYAAPFNITDPTIPSCGCSGGLTLGLASLGGTPGTAVDFAQALQGSVVDAEGKTLWSAQAWVIGGAASGSGWLRLTLVLSAGDATHQYSGWGSLSTVDLRPSGWSYAFRGVFELASGADEGASAPPDSGSFYAELVWWPDGTPVATTLSLTAA